MAACQDPNVAVQAPKVEQAVLAASVIVAVGRAVALIAEALEVL